MNTNKEYLVLLSKILLTTLIFTNYSYARFMVEPFYKSYQGEFSRGTEDGNLSGQVYGLNLGYLGEYFMAGMSFENGQYKSDNTLTENNYEKYTGGGIGSYLGFHFLDRYKLWTGYLNSTLEPTENTDYRLFGQHVSFGLGVRVYEGLMFNIEGFRNQYTQQENDLTGKTTGLGTNIKSEGTSYFLSYFLIF